MIFLLITEIHGNLYGRPGAVADSAVKSCLRDRRPKPNPGRMPAVCTFSRYCGFLLHSIHMLGGPLPPGVWDTPQAPQ